MRAAAEELRKGGVKVGDAVSEALRTMEESELARTVCARPHCLYSDTTLILLFLPFSLPLPTFQISRATTAVSSTIVSTTEPIRNTAAYKTLAETLVDALDDSGTAKHAGFEEKEARRARRQMRLAKAGKEGRIKARVVANPEYVFLNTSWP